MAGICISTATRDVYAPWLLERHYARRIPPVSYAFALIVEGTARGVVTFGPPASPQVRQSVAPSLPRGQVLELNRLVIDETPPFKDAASFLVGRALRLLPPAVVVSYADGKMGHVGYIYQATNFEYGGAAKAHDAEYLVDGKPTHPRTLAARGITAPKAWAKENGIVVLPPHPKHRYWYVTGGRKALKTLAPQVRWPSLPYPKGDSRRYDPAEGYKP